MEQTIFGKPTRQQLAAQNNADLYKHMFKAHGIAFEVSKGLFQCTVQPLPFYSSIVTLNPATSPDPINKLAGSAHFDLYVKDSFADLPLANSGFLQLFDANWFRFDERGDVNTTGWEKVATPSQLKHWEAAWKDGGNQTAQTMFPSNLLDDTEITFWGYKQAGSYTKGFIGNDCGHATGLSNVFANTLCPHTYHEMAQLLQTWRPQKPVVGYTRGQALEHALQAGFESTGDLRVWLKPVSPS
ncbi:hypothetical protein GCM10007094_24430 [Pseudovibrio japonicus]|uniref:Uncharacterized protein n=1 Tax=Pseudovibrio japonicus TaxID=366534 RepID=A0ABQ3ELH0_9HYPH|nr:hypothetical protein [Pseudovibrio japonicus]GHB34392.1 hypothetical protein GCM10007094_24430 [Pseudovibrio japonicus]